MEPPGGQHQEEAAPAVVLRSPFPAGVAFAWAGPSRLPGAALLPAERALLSGRAAEKRVREFALGRACAHRALAQLEPGAAGAPVLRVGERRPRWPAAFAGSITHKGAYAAAVACRTGEWRGVGLDLERARVPSPGLLRRTLRPEEQAWLEAQPPGERALGFALVFSAKESLYKALNPLTDVYLGFQEAAIELESGALAAPEGALRWRLHAGCGPDFPVGSAGAGGFTRSGAWVLTGVWVAA